METQEKIKTHDKDVKAIQNQLLKWKEGEISSVPDPSNSHTMRKKPYALKAPPLSSRKLDRILGIDKARQTIRVEPYVTQDQWAEYCIREGFIPPVVAEFKKITVGGGIMGSSLESSSHRWGQMNDSAMSYELLLGDGSVIHASPEENPELFYGVSGSYGAFARILSAEFPLLVAKPFVNVSSFTFDSIERGIQHLMELCSEASRPEYIEALVIDRNRFKIIVGEMSDTAKYEQFSLKSSGSMWYHQKVIHDSTPFSMTLYDYLFRYDRGAFWMGTYALWGSLLTRFWFEGTPFMPQMLLNKLKSFPKGHYNTPKYPNALFRSLSGWMMDSADLYKWLHWKRENWFEKNFVVQDFYLPTSKTTEFIHYALDTTEIKPLWICPCKGTKTPQLFSPQVNEEPLLFDVGVYGFPIENHSAEEATRLLEKKTYELSGKKMFYSWNFMTEEELFTHYDKASYDNLRELGKAEGVFPPFTQKTAL
ncbi:MAG: FAD-binding oxidoreductase [Chlamydiia bacterium]|nr:FAD-binding oxidoreductase [Chlamydiia bacterium]